MAGVDRRVCHVATQSKEANHGLELCVNVEYVCAIKDLLTIAHLFQILRMSYNHIQFKTGTQNAHS